MRHFQEGGYSRRQFKNWVIANGIYDKKGSSIATMTALILELTERGKMTSLVICTLGAIARKLGERWVLQIRHCTLDGQRRFCSKMS